MLGRVDGRDGHLWSTLEDAMDPKIIEDLARRLAANVPGSVRALQADLERNFESVLGGTFERLNLVTREEFDVQRRVLERTRERLTQVESELRSLEERLTANRDA
jgi:hypothetical protein